MISRNYRPRYNMVTLSKSLERGIEKKPRYFMMFKSQFDYWIWRVKYSEYVRIYKVFVAQMRVFNWKIVELKRCTVEMHRSRDLDILRIKVIIIDSVRSPFYATSSELTFQIIVQLNLLQDLGSRNTGDIIADLIIVHCRFFDSTANISHHIRG